ncbi:hypothetical protein [Desulfotomaculum sp. 1211_IL3151]|uniref:hypothetical protein n=1 Tax=Desulfotomaculum sp. 1211_IL3151 TaxID=3084055 RepID=UPI002FDB5D37
MKSIAFYEFLDALKSKTDKINSFLEKYSIEEIIFALKGNGFGVDAYPGSRSYKNFLELRPLIICKASNQMKEQLVHEYEFEITLWNQLFHDFYSKDQFEKVTEVPDEKKIFAFLIAFEVYIRALNDFRFNKGKNRDHYGKVELQKRIDGEIKGVAELSANQFTDAVDYLFQQASRVVQAFLFYGYLYKNNKFVCCTFEEEIDWEFLNQSMMHFPLIDIRNVLFDTFEDWKFGNYKLEKLDENNIRIIPQKIKDLVNQKIEIQRFQSFRHSIMFSESSNKDKIKECNYLAPKAFLDNQEESSYKEYLEYFSSDNLSYKVCNIEIAKWLRAYSIIRHVNREFINKKMFPDLNKPNEWLYVSSKDEWIDKFLTFGIDKKSAEIIFNKLRFKKNSIDWFDSPLIEFGEKIVTIPSYASYIQDSLALMSLASKENFSLDFKGYCFEDRVLDDLNKNQIPAVSVKRQFENEEYQCDVAFILGKDLFLCECKHTIQPSTQRKRYDFYNRKIPEDVNQINRISEFYSSHIDILSEELNKKRKYDLPNDWKPRHIYKILIYSCKLPGKLYKDEVIITDYTILSTLLYKRLPTFFKNGEPIRQVMPPKMKGVYQGKLTTNKLLNFIESPWQIGFQKAFTKVEDEIVPINKINLHRKKASRTIDDFYDLKK